MQGSLNSYPEESRNFATLRRCFYEKVFLYYHHGDRGALPRLWLY
jgi:hypothetical protein